MKSGNLKNVHYWTTVAQNQTDKTQPNTHFDKTAQVFHFIREPETDISESCMQDLGIFVSTVNPCLLAVTRVLPLGLPVCHPVIVVWACPGQ